MMNQIVSCGAILLVLAAAGVSAQVPNCNAANNLQLFPDLNDCSRYYRCEHNYAILHTCPENLLYDQALHACNWEHNVNCNNNVAPPQQQPAKSCPAREDEQRPTHLPHLTDCGKFYKCWNGIPQLLECPAGQLWNQAMVACDYADQVVCNVNAWVVPPTEN